MRIFLIRHGRSEANEDPALYRIKGDSHVQLTEEGWAQAVRAGQFLAKYLEQHPQKKSLRHKFNWFSWQEKLGLAKPVSGLRMWVSAFLRTRQTAAGMIEGAKGAILQENVRITDLLVEQNAGIYDHTRTDPALEERLRDLDDFTKQKIMREPFYAQYLMGESAQQVSGRQRDMIQTIKTENEDKGIEDFALVMHGYSIRAFASALLGIDPERYKDISTPQNGSVYLIEGDFKAGWKFKQIYNGQTQLEVDIDMGTMLGLGIHTLPPVPPQHRL